MRPSLLPLLQCPACQADLTATATETRAEEIWTGALSCRACHAVFPVRDGMPLLYVDDQRWASKAVEAAGWVTYHKELGIYEPGEQPVDLQIPYFPDEPWLTVARSFDIVLDLLALSGAERVLDLGAGRGWAAKQFALRGCTVVALDIVADANVGLGRGHALWEEAGTFFERLIGDGENLPLQPGTFDLVFCSATLHHASDLPLLMDNISRVLKPGGRLCAMAEPCLGLLVDAAEVLARDAAQEMAHGINETRPNLVTYTAALHEAGLAIDHAFPPAAYGKTIAELLPWAERLGVVAPRLNLRRPRASFRSLRARRGWLKTVSAAGVSAALTPPPELDGWDALTYQLLLPLSQELILVARKPVPA
jgi:SAM-dependent methyltransferase